MNDSPSTRTTFPQLEKAILTLVEHAPAWLEISPAERASLLAEARHGVANVAERWVAAGLHAKGVEQGGPSESEEWFTGPWGNLLHLRRLEKAMRGIASEGRPVLPSAPRELSNGQVAVDVFPVDHWDRMFFPGVQAEIRLQPDVQLDEVIPTQALTYLEADPGVALVLGGGNCATIAVGDVRIFSLVL